MNFPALMWPRISQLFDEGSTLDEARREAWLAALDTDAADCAAYVRLMFAASQSAPETDQLSEQVQAMCAAALAAALHGPGRVAGAMLGPYRLIEPLGRGGMAEVWLAEQTAGVLRRVALKIPHVGLEEGRAAARRFAQERDFLAALEHPHIARLYDAGVSAEGSAYLAMELVAGVPITTFCDTARLAVPQRLALFQQVLGAVGHAHAHLVIHRDLKAGNILVTPDGQAKLLDFGIARLLDEVEAPGPPTGADSRVFTPDTAAPEQLAGQALSTASDVYSLGVVLYELLTGQRPYRLALDRPDLHAQLLDASIPLPSVNVSDAERAAARGTTPQRLRRQLAGGLDAIVFKALAPDVTRRYPSVEALGSDLTRHAGHWPVEAVAGGPAYRSGRFALRHRWSLLSGGAVALALCGGLAAALWQAERAQGQARRALAVQAFIKQVFSASDPQQAQGRDIGARELLQRGAARLETDLREQPELRAELLHEIADILAAQGANALARPQFERAIALYEQLGSGDSDTAVDARLSLVDILVNESQYAPAKALAQHSLALAQRRSGRPPPWVLHAQAKLAFITAQQGDPKAAVVMLNQALQAHRRAGWPASPTTTRALLDLGHAHMALEQYGLARDAFALAVAESATLADYTITGRLVCRMYLQYARFFLDEHEVVACEMPALLSEMDQHLGPQAGHTLNMRTLGAQVLAAMGRFDDSVQMQRDTVARAQARTTISGDAVAFQQGSLAKMLWLAARYQEGLEPATQALAFMDAKQPAAQWRAEVVRIVLGDLQRGAGQTQASLQTLLATQARVRTLAGSERSKRYAYLLVSLALTEHQLGHSADAQRDMAQARAIYIAELGPGHADTQRCAALAAWLQALAQPADAQAQAAFSEAAQAYARQRPAGHPAHAELELLRADLMQKNGGHAPAARDAQAAAALAWRAAMGRDWKPPLVYLH